MVREREHPPLRQEYMRLTIKYRERFRLGSGDVVAKTWVFNSPEGERRAIQDFRSRFREDINRGDNVPVEDPNVLDQLDLPALLSIYVLQEMEGQELEICTQLVLGGMVVSTIPVADKFEDDPLSPYSNPTHATIIRPMTGMLPPDLVSSLL